MCIEKCTDMCVGMCVDMCIATCKDMRVRICINMCVISHPSGLRIDLSNCSFSQSQSGQLVDMCVGMCIGMCIDMCIGMCLGLFGHVYGHMQASLEVLLSRSVVRWPAYYLARSQTAIQKAQVVLYAWAKIPN